MGDAVPPGGRGSAVESGALTGGYPFHPVPGQPDLAWQVQGDGLPGIGSRRRLVIQLLEAPILKGEFTLPVPPTPPPSASGPSRTLKEQ